MNMKTLGPKRHDSFFMVNISKAKKKLGLLAKIKPKLYKRRVNRFHSSPENKREFNVTFSKRIVPFDPFSSVIILS